MCGNRTYILRIRILVNPLLLVKLGAGIRILLVNELSVESLRLVEGSCASPRRNYEHRTKSTGRVRLPTVVSTAQHCEQSYPAKPTATTTIRTLRATGSLCRIPLCRARPLQGASAGFPTLQLLQSDGTEMQARFTALTEIYCPCLTHAGCIHSPKSLRLYYFDLW